MFIHKNVKVNRQLVVHGIVSYRKLLEHTVEIIRKKEIENNKKQKLINKFKKM